MKIRQDFITNSSSTNYIFIGKSELDESTFFKSFGIQDNSPLQELFAEFYQILVSNMHDIDDEVVGNYGNNEDAIVKYLDSNDFSDDIVQKVIQSIKNGSKVMVGTLSSDENEMESFLCCDYIVIDRSEIYFNGAGCVW